MIAVSKKLALLSVATAAVLSLPALAAPATASPAPTPASQPAPSLESAPPTFFQSPGRPMMMPPHGPGFCRGGELFCASALTDNPGETIQKLNSIIPAPSGGHYQVRISVERVPDHQGDKGHHPEPDAAAPLPPR
ncbi:hypothetical protein ACL2XP_17695 [Sodalis sp. RH21]|uniref:hypothetical protein n=1 Tax=unclassified Sodalis (in: enterobacteria) TaxID=2636512 RepID=UPI0039B62816